MFIRNNSCGSHMSYELRRKREMGEIKYEIVETIGKISESAKGWSKELNLISWGGRAAKYDLREWDPKHEKMGKGVTLTVEELKKLRDVLVGMEL
jgi:hypothetical protein